MSDAGIDKGTSPQREWTRVAARRFAALPRRSGAHGWLDVLFVPVAIVIAVAYFASVNENFLTGINLRNMILQAAVLAIVAFGITFVILAGELDLSVGSGTALASVIGATVMVDSGSVVLGIIVALAAGIAIGVVNGLIVTLLEVPSFIATFGMLVIASGIALSITDGGVVSGLPSGIGDISLDSFLGVRWLIWLVIAVFLVLYFVQTQTAFGVRVKAVGGNRVAARLSGLKVQRVRFLVFVLSGVTIGIAAVALTSRLESGQPNAGLFLELDAIAAVVVGGTSIFGGRGSLMRTLFGVLLIAVIRNGLQVEGAGDALTLIVIGLVLMLATSVEFFRKALARRRGSGRRREPLGA